MQRGGAGGWLPSLLVGLPCVVFRRGYIFRHTFRLRQPVGVTRNPDCCVNLVRRVFLTLLSRSCLEASKGATELSAHLRLLRETRASSLG